MCGLNVEIISTASLEVMKGSFFNEKVSKMVAYCLEYIYCKI